MRKTTNQHGDVILTKVTQIPKTAEKIKINKNFILEKGEGVHTHTVPDVDNLTIFMDDETMYLNVLKDIKIVHQEHGCQIVEPGLYVKEIERQFDYELEVERRVVD